MKIIYAVLAVALLALPAGGAWAGSDAGHSAMKGGMDLKKYDVKFTVIDTSGDGALSWEEYKVHFSDPDRRIFDALDSDSSGLIEQKEWHNFKSAHGMAGPGKDGKGKHHPTDLPDPSAYMVHMGDIDKDGNDALSWEEFKGHFPNADISVFEAIDMDKDGSVSHDEWHEFKSAHGKGEGYHHSGG